MGSLNFLWHRASVSLLRVSKKRVKHCSLLRLYVKIAEGRLVSVTARLYEPNRVCSLRSSNASRVPRLCASSGAARFLVFYVKNWRLLGSEIAEKLRTLAKNGQFFLKNANNQSFPLLKAEFVSDLFGFCQCNFDDVPASSLVFCDKRQMWYYVVFRFLSEYASFNGSSGRRPGCGRERFIFS